MPKVILGRLCVNRMIGKKLRAWTGGAKETGKRQVDFHYQMNLIMNPLHLSAKLKSLKNRINIFDFYIKYINIKINIIDFNIDIFNI